MVDGDHGHVMGHAVRHVVVEHKNGLEDVTILHLPVKEMIVRAIISKELHVVLAIAVLVRLCYTVSMYVQCYVHDVHVYHICVVVTMLKWYHLCAGNLKYNALK